MSSFDCQKNIKEHIEYGPIIVGMAGKWPNGLLITHFLALDRYF